MEKDLKKAEAVIFDMDGTLYQFPSNGTYTASPFGQAIQENVIAFIAAEFDMTIDNATQRYALLNDQFEGEMSLGLEREFGIDRMRFFAETWNLDAGEFIAFDDDLRSELEQINATRVVLSSAPRVWANQALGYMGIADLFGDRIFTGEPDIRKPAQAAFRQILDSLGVNAREVISIGDQEQSDILPAQSLGMFTVRIGSCDTAADMSAANVIDAIARLQEKGLL